MSFSLLGTGCFPGSSPGETNSPWKLCSLLQRICNSIRHVLRLIFPLPGLISTTSQFFSEDIFISVPVSLSPLSTNNSRVCFSGVIPRNSWVSVCHPGWAQRILLPSLPTSWHYRYTAGHQDWTLLLGCFSSFLLWSGRPFHLDELNIRSSAKALCLWPYTVCHTRQEKLWIFTISMEEYGQD